MLENDNKKQAPKVEFTFRDEEKSEEERKKEIEELLKKRNELLISMGFSITNNSDLQEESKGYPRR